LTQRRLKSVNYVIGAVVNKSSSKKEALEKAEKLGLKTMRLPVLENREMPSELHLNCNHGLLNSV